MLLKPFRPPLAIELPDVNQSNGRMPPLSRPRQPSSAAIAKRVSRLPRPNERPDSRPVRVPIHLDEGDIASNRGWSGRWLPAASGGAGVVRTISCSQVPRRRSAPKRRAWCAPSVGNERSRYPPRGAARRISGRAGLPFGRDAFVPQRRWRHGAAARRVFHVKTDTGLTAFRGSAQLGKPADRSWLFVLAGPTSFDGIGALSGCCPSTSQVVEHGAKPHPIRAVSPPL
jgi:hypothetical protein